MQFFIILILLGFPLTELWLLIDLTYQYGWGFIGYLVLVGYLGYRLLQDEKFSMMGRMAQSMRAGQTPVGMMFGMFKNSLAGILLIIPGILSDIIAVILLLWPSHSTPANDSLYENTSFSRDQSENPFSSNPFSSQTSSENAPESECSRKGQQEIIEGEFRREE